MFIYILEVSYDYEGFEIHYISENLDNVIREFHLTTLGDQVDIIKYNIDTQESITIKTKR